MWVISYQTKISKASQLTQNEEIEFSEAQLEDVETMLFEVSSLWVHHCEKRFLSKQYGLNLTTSTTVETIVGVSYPLVHWIDNSIPYLGISAAKSFLNRALSHIFHKLTPPSIKAFKDFCRIRVTNFLIAI